MAPAATNDPQAAEPPHANDLDLDLDEDYVVPQRPRRRLSLVTALLAVCAVGGGFFVAGVAAQRHWGASSGGSPSVAALSAVVGGSGSSAASGQGASGASSAPAVSGFQGAGSFQPTLGTVTAVKGSTLYVTDLTGNTVLVKTTKDTVFTKTKRLSARDVRPDDFVVVQTSKDQDGGLTARSVTVGGGSGPGSLPFGGGLPAQSGTQGGGAPGAQPGGTIPFPGG